MKQATGDLNATVVVLAAVAMLSAVFFMIIWPMIRRGLQEEANCSTAVCDIGYNNNGMAYCYNPQDPSREVFECPFRG